MNLNLLENFPYNTLTNLSHPEWDLARDSYEGKVAELYLE